MDMDDIDPKVRTITIQPYQWWNKAEWDEYRYINSDRDMPDEEFDARFLKLEQAAFQRANYLTNARLGGYSLVIDPEWPHHISFFDIDTKFPKGGIDE